MGAGWEEAYFGEEGFYPGVFYRVICNQYGYISRFGLNRSGGGAGGFVAGYGVGADGKSGEDCG